MVTETAKSSTRRKIRARLPKVRTGCLTCRVRRIKCDEGKPYCLKCVSTGRTCDGYQTESKAICKKRDPSPRVLLPDTLAASYAAPGSASFILGKKAIKRHVQLNKPLRLLFTNEQEHRYFRLFCDKVTLQLSGYFESGIWSQLILQASEQDEAIRHAVIAIGALDMVLEGAKKSNCAPTSTEILRHHQFALEQYSKAIARMRTATAETSPSLRTTLLTCLLIFCFENLHGNFESALAQVQSGLRLLEDWHKSFATTSSATTQAPEAPSPGSSTFGIVSPAPSMVEDEILQAFGRLDMQAVSWIDRRPIAYHSLAKQCGATSIARMPVKFTSIPEARIYWELVMRRLMHFICSAHVPHIPAPDSSNPSPSHPLSSNNKPDGGILNRNLNSNRFISTQTEQDQRTHLSELSRWHNAFADLYSAHRASPIGKSFRGALALQLRFLAAQIALSCSLGRSQMIFDNYLSSFREIVSLAKTLLAHSDSSNSFTFDLGFIAQLYVVGIRCRDHETRREAISLLLSKPWREGVWDSILAGRMAGAVMEIEEEGAGFGPDRRTSSMEEWCLSTELYPAWLDPQLHDFNAERNASSIFIPESARVMGTKVAFNCGENKMATLSCFLRDSSPDAVGGTRVVKRHIRW